jgi:poly-gamma-glutamate capsule biosynthesis protein CapA/YwtB (metallophosphatase superfamily)
MTASESRADLTLFLCGDVMPGRGIDQILPHPGDPRLHEGGTASALTYVELAEAANGPMPRSVAFSYVWGDALAALGRRKPDLRIANLETSITRHDVPWPKGINYRMSPQNVGCLAAMRFDCCVLANNHVLDWGLAGLTETLETLQRERIATAGAGRDRDAAAAPAVLTAGARRVLVFGFGTLTSGIPAAWAAGSARPGVNLLRDLSEQTLDAIAHQAAAAKRPGDLLVASLHWGGNWGYPVPDDHRRFAHGLIDRAGFDVVHGHSSHHAKGIEIYRDKLILYGCGDFLNDYEGIEGYERYRDDLAVAYLATCTPTGELRALALLAFCIRRFCLKQAAPADVAWLQATLDRESMKLGTRVVAADGWLAARWG